MSTINLGEYMNARVVEEKAKTKVWKILNTHHGSELGTVKWNGAWRQYCFFPNTFADTVFSVGCLVEIEKFLTFVNNEKKKEMKKT